jgi:hypothetical protein
MLQNIRRDTGCRLCRLMPGFTCPQCYSPAGPNDQTCAKCGARLKPSHNPLAMDRQSAPMRVTITDLDMPIGSMIVLLLKLAVASIPAAIVISVVGFVIVAALAVIGAGVGMSSSMRQSSSQTGVTGVAVAERPFTISAEEQKDETKWRERLRLIVQSTDGLCPAVTAIQNRGAIGQGNVWAVKCSNSTSYAVTLIPDRGPAVAPCSLWETTHHQACFLNKL